jgi:hypothetical protein
MKTRHQLAFAEVEKLRKSKDDDEDLESRGSVILMASFCEDLPREAVPEISLDDQVPIGRHIEKVTTEYALRQGGAQPQKKLKPRPQTLSRR